MKSFKDLREKTLTPAEKKKREEIAKAMERENPGMDMKKKMAIATWQAKKVAEAKDPNEYDKEGDMMKNQLRQICSANEKLMKMVGDDDNLPEWVQNKVTKATDYIRSVRDYLDAEDSDEDDEDESMEESVTISPLQKIRMDKEKADRNKDDKDKSQAKRMTDKQYAGYKVKMKEETEELDEISRDLARRYIRKVADKTNTGELNTKQVMKRRPGVNLAGKKAYPGVAGEPKVRATESVEQIDELSKKTLTSYIKKAAGDAVTKAYRAGDVRDKDSGKNYIKALGRQIGISTATNKLTKEESEQIDELDKKTLGSYIKKASTNQIGNTAKVLAGKNDPETERARKRMGQRMSGIAKATDKLTKEEAEQIDELKKSTLGSYVKKASGNMAGNAAVAAAQASSSMGKSSPETKRNITNRMKGIAKATDRLTKEEAELDENVGGLFKNASEWESSAKARGLVVKSATHPSGEMTKYQIAKDKQGNNRGHFDHGTKSGRLKEEAEQIDELSKKTLGSYVKKAKDDLGNREAEVTRNRYVDPRGVKDPVKHNNTLLMKRANRRDNINKAVDKLTKEAVQSADRKPERYIRPDGKVGIRMVKTDKKMVKND